MAGVLDPQLKRALAERVRFYNELGIYDFYRRDPAESNLSDTQDSEMQPEQREEMTPRTNAAARVVRGEDSFEVGEARIECDRSGAGAAPDPRRPRRLHALCAA